MGVDTKAIIRKGTTLKEIKETLEEKYSDVKVNSTSSNYYFTYSFDTGKGRRMLSAFFNDYALNDYGIDGVLLSLGHDKEAIEIMLHILEKFGGYIDESDCDDEDYYPVNIEEYKKSKSFTKTDELRNDIAQKLGFENIETTMLLFEKYKSLSHKN